MLSKKQVSLACGIKYKACKENKFMRCRQFVVQKFQLLTIERVMKIRVVWFFGAVNFFSFYFLPLRVHYRGKKRLLAFNLTKLSKEKTLAPEGRSFVNSVELCAKF